MAPSAPFLLSLALAGVAAAQSTFPIYSFDGVTTTDEEFVVCHNVTEVLWPTSVDEMTQMVKDANAAGKQVRASGLAHMWYDTMCSDVPTTIIKTGNVSAISDFSLAPGAQNGTVTFEAGVTFFQLADFLHARNASMGYTLVNWNMTIAGAIATGSHRMSLQQPSMVSAGAVGLDIINGRGELVHLDKDESNDTWNAATTSLGLLGIIARVEFMVYPEFKLSANQSIMDEADWLDADYYSLISPFPTANFWWWPGLRKVHYRTYSVVPSDTAGETLQTTFSITQLEADTALALLNAGQNSSAANAVAETTFFGLWSAPNYVLNRNSILPILSWPTVGWSYDALIGGLVRGEETEWEGGLHGYTFEIACPIPLANQMLKRARELMDEEAANGHPITATYRSGINIKFGMPFNNLLGQTTETDSADWSKGALMLDWPSFWPTTGNHSRYDEPFYHKLAQTLIDEFPVRPHWTKNTREVFEWGVKNLDSDHLQRFATVRENFDPDDTFSSILGEIIGVSPAKSPSMT